MFANFIAENATGTTGDISLGGARPGHIAFSETFTNGQSVAYALEDGDGIKKCGGVGTYNSGANSITRSDSWTWDGTTYDVAPKDNLTLSGNTHIVRITPLAADLIGWANHVANTNNPHNTSLANLNSGTIANLQAAVTDTTLFHNNIHLVPSANITYNLGEHIKQWSKIHGNTVFVDNLHIGSGNSGYRLIRCAHYGVTTESAILLYGSPITILFEDDLYSTHNFSITNGEVSTDQVIPLVKVRAEFTADHSQTTTSDRFSVEWWLEEYNGSTWSAIVDSYCYTYHRNSEDGRSTASVEIFSKTLFGATNRKLRARCQCFSQPATTLSTNDPQGDLTILSGGCRLTIEELPTLGFDNAWDTSNITLSDTAFSGAPRDLKAYFTIKINGLLTETTLQSGSTSPWEINNDEPLVPYYRYEYKYTGNGIPTVIGGAIPSLNTWTDLTHDVEIGTQYVFSGGSDSVVPRTGTIALRIKGDPDSEVSRSYSLTAQTITI